MPLEVPYFLQLSSAGSTFSQLLFEKVLAPFLKIPLDKEFYAFSTLKILLHCFVGKERMYREEK